MKKSLTIFIFLTSAQTYAMTQTDYVLSCYRTAIQKREIGFYSVAAELCSHVKSETDINAVLNCYLKAYNNSLNKNPAGSPDAFGKLCAWVQE